MELLIFDCYFTEATINFAIVCTLTVQVPRLDKGGVFCGTACSHCHQAEEGFLHTVLCRGTFLVLFINSPRLSSLTEPGLGAPLVVASKGGYISSIDK